jgi:hypothetical protein
MSIVSDGPNSFTHPPAVGSRRVSVTVVLPVILGCAVLGSIMGVTHPLRGIFSGAQKPADRALASVRMVEDAPVAGQQRPTPDLPAQLEAVAAGSVASRSQSTPLPAVTALNTGSVNRSPPPGASENAALTVSDQASPARITGQSRIARAKRLRRFLGRRVRSKPPGSEIGGFFSSLFPKQ